MKSSDLTRSPGRPKAQEPGSTVTTWIPVSLHDRLIQLAEAHGESVSATIRVCIEQRMKSG